MSNEKKITILIADDDEDFRWQQKVQLEAAGYEVIEAENEHAARELLKDTKPDLAMIDLMMDEMDAGFTLSYYIKKLDPSIPVILITGVTSETGMEFDASTPEERSWIKTDVVLTKPVRFEQLNKEIIRLIKR